MKKLYNLTIRRPIATNFVKFTLLCLCAFTFVSSLNAQTITYSFTSAGATGSLGPTQLQVTTAYAGTNLSLVTCPSGIQSWTVPTSGLYLIDAAGAAGGDAPNYNKIGGAGSRMIGTFNLIAGNVCQILVGQRGGNGCGNGGGGGGSYVVCNGSLVVAAGGGGGCSSDQNGANAATVTAGTADNPSVTVGGTNGLGAPTCNTGSYNGGGGGGFLAVGGNGQTPTTGGGGGFSFLNGGVGGFGHLNSSVGPAGGFGGGGGGSNCTVGGGGGGGYSGGAGGQHLNQCVSNSARTGGGGGGSLNASANQTNTAGFNAGNPGRVIITSLCNISLTSSGTNSLNPSICSGQSLTLTTNAVSNYSWSTGAQNSASIVVTPTITTTFSVSATSSANCSASSLITVTVSGGLPVLSVTSSTNILCLGRTLTLTASGALTYTWTGGATNGIGFIPTVTNTYVVTGQNGCGTSTAAVPVTVAPLPVTAVAQPTISCATRPVSLTATSGVTGYTWQPGNLTGGNIVVGPSTNASYTVTASDGTCSGVTTVSFVVNPLPTITIVASSSVVCQGAPVTMTASGGLSYTWNPGNINGSNVTFNPTGPTLYSVVANNSFGCTDGANQVVLTSSSPTITIAASDNLICGGGSSTLTASGANTYTWVNNSNNPVLVVNPLTSTIYTISGLGANSACVGTETVLIAVFNPTVSISGSTAICIGATATLTGSGADTYQWDNGAPVPVISVSPLITTQYTLSALTASGNINCPTTTTFQVLVNPNPTVNVVPTRTFMCIKESNTLTASGAPNYSWSTGATTNSIVVSSTIASTINYSVVGTDANGCKNSKVYQLKINGCTAIEENSNTSGFTFYPNPSNGNVFLESQIDLELRITNELGQLIKVVSLNAGNGRKLQLNDLSDGIYFITGDKINAKLVVQK